MAKIYITENGKLLLEQKIVAQTALVRSIQEEKSIAYSISGDGWHDNPGYNQLIQAEAQAITDLKALEKQLNNATIWDSSYINTEKIAINTIVKLSMQSPKDKFARLVIYEIVGHGESDLKNKKISYDSPIGAAIYELKKDDEVQVSIPVGLTKIKIFGLYSNWSKIP